MIYEGHGVDKRREGAAVKKVKTRKQSVIMEHNGDDD